MDSLKIVGNVEVVLNNSDDTRDIVAGVHSAIQLAQLLDCKIVLQFKKFPKYELFPTTTVADVMDFWFEFV